MSYVIVRALLPEHGATPMNIMTLEEWGRACTKYSTKDIWESVAQTDTLEEAEALVRLLPKRNEEWINDKK